MLDKSKLPPDTWPRMLWLPGERTAATDRPILLISDRRRALIAGLPMLVIFILAIVLAVLRAPAALVLALAILALVIGLYARGGRSGYYELSADGTLGDFLGRRPPAALRSMQAKRVTI